MNNNALFNKKIQTWIILALVILNIIAFIFIANKAYVRVDMTAGKKYSVSKPTKNLLAKLDNTLVIEYYYNDQSKEISGVAQIIQYVIDMLKEYENAGKGNVNVVIKELSFNKPSDQALINELDSKGIKQYSLNQTDNTESKSLLGFSGMIIKYKEQESIIPSVFQDVGFEFRIDSEISKLVGEEIKVGIICASKSGSLEREFKYVKQVLDQEFKDVRVLQTNHNIPTEINLLVVIGGSSVLSDFDIFQIDQFLLAGGKAFFLTNGVNVEISQYGMFGSPTDNKLLEMLSSYGVTINKNLVGDNQSYNPIRQGFSLSRYPLWLKVKSSNFNQNNIISNGMNTLALLWCSSLTINDAAADKVSPLFTTTADSWAQDQNYQLDIDSYKYPVQEGGNKYTLGVTYDGTITSYFAGKDVPKNEADEKEQFTGTQLADGNAKFVIIPCEQMLHANFAGNDELLFFMNSIDWLSKDGSLIEIRNKGKFSQPLDKVKNIKEYNAKKSLIIGLSTFGVPVIFIIIGVVFYIMSNIRKQKLYAYYSKKNKEE